MCMKKEKVTKMMAWKQEGSYLVEDGDKRKGFKRLKDKSERGGWRKMHSDVNVWKCPKEATICRQLKLFLKAGEKYHIFYRTVI